MEVEAPQGSPAAGVNVNVPSLTGEELRDLLVNRQRSVRRVSCLYKEKIPRANDMYSSLMLVRKVLVRLILLGVYECLSLLCSAMLTMWQTFLRIVQQRGESDVLETLEGRANHFPEFSPIVEDIIREVI